jgi:hypothetical protein
MDFLALIFLHSVYSGMLKNRQLLIIPFTQARATVSNAPQLRAAPIESDAT